jgi:hypothetical protein
MSDPEKIVYVSDKPPEEQIRRTLGKITCILNAASEESMPLETKIHEIDTSLAYLLRLRAQLLAVQVVRTVNFLWRPPKW